MTEEISMIETQATFVTTQANNSADLFSITRDEFVSWKINFSLGSINQDLHSVFKYAIMEKKIYWETQQLSIWEDVTFTGDPEKIGQILFNFIWISLKFASVRSLRFGVEVESINRSEKMVKFQISATSPCYQKKFLLDLLELHGQFKGS